MKPEIEAQWLAALRSGEYEQGQGELRDAHNRFCCLGVLCDLHAKAGLGEWNDRQYLNTPNILPEAVVQWAGLSDDVPEVNGMPLTDLNDGINGYDLHTFAEIADLIEAHL